MPTEEIPPLSIDSTTPRGARFRLSGSGQAGAVSDNGGRRDGDGGLCFQSKRRLVDGKQHAMERTSEAAR